MQLDLRETTVRTVVRDASSAQTMARHQLRRELLAGAGDESVYGVAAYSTAVYDDQERATLLSGILGAYDRAHDAWCQAQRLRLPAERETVLWDARSQAWNAVTECLAALHQHLIDLDTLEPADVSEPPQWRDE